MATLPTCSICLTVEEGALVLEALGSRPFKEVFELIGRINRQANEQLTHTTGELGETRFECDRRELELMLRSLAELPFNRVHLLMAKLHAQLQEQSELRQTGCAS